jgi:hypothetical protein
MLRPPAAGVPILLVAALFATGCDPGNRTTPVRPGGARSASRPPRPNDQPVASSNRPPRDADPNETPETNPPAMNSRHGPARDPFYQIELVSGDRNGAQTAPRDDTLNCVMKHVDARDAARVLAMLYSPLGSGGTQHSAYVVYRDPTAQRAAGRMLRYIDTPMPTDESITVADVSFRRGMGILMELTAGVDMTDPQRAATALDALTRGAQSANPLLRWASAMLAGRVESDVRFDDPAARAWFDKAVEAADAGSIQALMARWATAETYAQAENHDALREAGAAIVRDFRPLRDTAVYHRAVRAAN